jgi:hypothetical protein
VSLFAVVLLIVFVLVVVPIAFWILQGLYRGARGAKRGGRAPRPK